MDEQQPELEEDELADYDVPKHLIKPLPKHDPGFNKRNKRGQAHRDPMPLPEEK